MKMIALGALAAVVLGVAAAALLTENNVLAYQEFSTTGTRVSKPGINLVGPRWTGDYRQGSEGEKP